VRGAVVFTHPNAELELDDPPVPVMLPQQLKGWLRRAGKLPPLPKEAMTRLAQVLDEAAGVDEADV
jgi:hypothetical protein